MPAACAGLEFVSRDIVLAVVSLVFCFEGYVLWSHSLFQVANEADDICHSVGPTVAQVSFCSLAEGITPKICRLCVCVVINKRSFEPFMRLDHISVASESCQTTAAGVP